MKMVYKPDNKKIQDVSFMYKLTCIWPKPNKFIFFVRCCNMYLCLLICNKQRYLTKQSQPTIVKRWFFCKKVTIFALFGQHFHELVAWIVLFLLDYLKKSNKKVLRVESWHDFQAILVFNSKLFLLACH